MDFVQKRIKEIQGKQTTFGTPDIEQLKPMLKDIQKGNYRELVIGYTSKDGLQVLFSTRNTFELIELLQKQAESNGHAQ